MAIRKPGGIAESGYWTNERITMVAGSVAATTGTLAFLATIAVPATTAAAVVTSLAIVGSVASGSVGMVAGITALATHDPAAAQKQQDSLASYVIPSEAVRKFGGDVLTWTFDTVLDIANKSRPDHMPSPKRLVELIAELVQEAERARRDGDLVETVAGQIRDQTEEELQWRERFLDRDRALRLEREVRDDRPTYVPGNLDHYNFLA